MTMKRIAKRAMPALFVLAVAIANAAAAVGTLPVKACDLLTVKDVQGVLGNGYTPQDSVSNQIMSSCAYTKSKADVVTVTVMQEFRSATETLKMEQEGVRQHGGAITPVSGLGDGAYYLLEPKNNIFQLNFGKKNLRVTVTVDSGGKPNLDAAIKLAKIAYARLA